MISPCCFATQLIPTLLTTWEPKSLAKFRVRGGCDGGNRKEDLWGGGEEGVVLEKETKPVGISRD